MNIKNIDCFAGGGGASTGMEEAGVRVDIAINHDPMAILMHRTNHPDTLHLTEDIFEVDLSKYLKATDKVGVMWASPDCTSHSRAKGGQPRENGLRILPWSVYRLCKQIMDITGELPQFLFMENVEEIQKWCPLTDEGKPVAKMEGECYKCFISSMTTGDRKVFCDKNYTCSSCENKNNCIYEYCIDCNYRYANVAHLRFNFGCTELCAADYGAPTTRKRWYAVFRSDGKEVKFPKPTHSKDGSNGLKKWIPVSTVIDWTDLGKSIFARKKPLAEATQRRIANGIRKFIINAEDPFIVPEKEATAFLIQYHGETVKGDARGQTINEPLQTIDTSNRYALVTAFITKFYKTGVGQGCDEPLHTITTSPGHFGLVSAFLIKYYGGDGVQSVEEPIHTITTKDRFGLVNVVLDIHGEKYIIHDIFLRMLKPEELKLAQGFPKYYVINKDYTGKKYPVKEQVARIGNSVVPVMAKAIVEVNLKE